MIGSREFRKSYQKFLFADPELGY